MMSIRLITLSILTSLVASEENHWPRARQCREDHFTYDAVVVGAGLSGLVAAKYLDKAGLGTLVLEARDRVGMLTSSLTRH